MLEPSNNGQAKKQLDMGVKISASTGVEGPRTVVCKSCASFNKLSSGLVSQNQHLYRLEQILHCGAVTTISWIAPGNNGSIVQNGSKCNSCGLNLPHIPKLPLNCRAVTTRFWIAPGHNGSIRQDGCKCIFFCGLNLLYSHLTLDCQGWHPSLDSPMSQSCHLRDTKLQRLLLKILWLKHNCSALLLGSQLAMHP